jgi:thermostable 8-oxoguanine DNA glycosylase
MKLIWEIEERDVAKIREFYQIHENNSFVARRRKRNVNKELPQFTNEIFWEAMVSCLLTTQQRSGPESAVTRFISSKPFPLSYEVCNREEDLRSLAEITITRFGGIRRGTTLASEISENYTWLNSGGWNIINRTVSELIEVGTVDEEIKASEKIAMNLKGFGPKQSRNLLQALGLTKYEIPIDSRISKWMNDFGFPVQLSATALSDHNYYKFVSEGFRRMCAASGIYPCLLDAAIFSSFDGEWPEDKLVW